VPMEDMDLLVDPARRAVTVDPLSPDSPHARVKAVKRLPFGPGDTTRRASATTARSSAAL
jgi:hypothetical protein